MSRIELRKRFKIMTGNLAHGLSELLVVKQINISRRPGHADSLIWCHAFMSKT